MGHNVLSRHENEDVVFSPPRYQRALATPKTHLLYLIQPSKTCSTRVSSSTAAPSPFGWKHDVCLRPPTSLGNAGIDAENHTPPACDDAGSHTGNWLLHNNSKGLGISLAQVPLHLFSSLRLRLKLDTGEASRSPQSRGVGSDLRSSMSARG